MLLDPQSITWLHQLWQRLTDQRAAKIDNLDAKITTRQDLATALAQYQALLDKLSKIGYQCAIFDTPGPFSFVAPDGVSMMYLSGCSGGSGAARNGSNCSGGGASAAILALPLPVPQSRSISGVIGAAGTNTVNVTAQQVEVNGTSGTQTTILGLGIPVGLPGNISNTSPVLCRNGTGGTWGKNTKNREAYGGILTSFHTDVSQGSRTHNYFCDGADGGVGSAYSSLTGVLNFTNNTTGGLGGASPLMGVAKTLTSSMAIAGCGGTATTTANTPPGAGLVLLEWFGVPA